MALEEDEVVELPEVEDAVATIVEKLGISLVTAQLLIDHQPLPFDHQPDRRSSPSMPAFCFLSYFKLLVVSVLYFCW